MRVMYETGHFGRKFVRYAQKKRHMDRMNELAQGNDILTLVINKQEKFVVLLSDIGFSFKILMIGLSISVIVLIISIAHNHLYSTKDQVDLNADLNQEQIEETAVEKDKNLLSKNTELQNSNQSS